MQSRIEDLPCFITWKKSPFSLSIKGHISYTDEELWCTNKEVESVLKEKASGSEKHRGSTYNDYTPDERWSCWLWNYQIKNHQYQFGFIYPKPSNKIPANISGYTVVTFQTIQTGCNKYVQWNLNLSDIERSMFNPLHQSTWKMLQWPHILTLATNSYQNWFKRLQEAFSPNKTRMTISGTKAQI